MPRDHVLEALRALADLPEHAPEGALAFWLGELERRTGWVVVERDGVLDARAPDGRTWSVLRLVDVLRLLEGVGEA